MDNLKKHLNKDYFRLNKTDKLKTVRYVNIALLSVAIIWLINFLFYLIVYITTYYSHLTQLDTIVQDFSKKGQFEFNQIEIGLKIMPSYNTEHNSFIMRKTNDFKRTRIIEGNDLMERYNMNYSYFLFNNTEEIFPSLNYKPDYIPVGSSLKMCFGLSWSLSEKGHKYELMKEIENLPQCEATKNGQFIWNDEDTKFGLDIPVWVQHENDIDCGNEADCDYYCDKYYNAEFINAKKGKKCYSYEVLSAICLAIKYNPIKDSWVYSGGCFKDGKNYLLEPAKINNRYSFDSVEIEIRNDQDPIIQAGLISKYTYNFGSSLRVLGSILKFFLIISILVLIIVAGYVYLERLKKPAAPLLEKDEKQENHENHQNQVNQVRKDYENDENNDQNNNNQDESQISKESQYKDSNKNKHLAISD